MPTRNSKMSNLDMAEIMTAAAEWASASEHIKRITLHRFKPELIENQNVLWAIIIWVSPDIDVTMFPWKENKTEKGTNLPRLKDEYRNLNGQRDTDKIEAHPLYSLWDLYSSIQGRKSFSLFYNNSIDMELFDPKYDWIVFMDNIGDEKFIFSPDGAYYDLDTSDVGSMVLFPKNENSSTEQETPDSSSGKERQELGRLRQERSKWENSITAALSAAMSLPPPVTRDTLKDHLFPFGLPDTTVELIWRKLREADRTKLAGRPKNPK